MRTLYLDSLDFTKNISNSNAEYFHLQPKLPLFSLFNYQSRHFCPVHQSYNDPNLPPPIFCKCCNSATIFYYSFHQRSVNPRPSQNSDDAEPMFSTTLENALPCHTALPKFLFLLILALSNASFSIIHLGFDNPYLFLCGSINNKPTVLLSLTLACYWTAFYWILDSLLTRTVALWVSDQHARQRRTFCLCWPQSFFKNIIINLVSNRS